MKRITAIIATGALCLMFAAPAAAQQDIDPGCTSQFPVDTPDGCKVSGGTEGDPCPGLTGEALAACQSELGITTPQPIPNSLDASATASASAPSDDVPDNGTSWWECDQVRVSRGLEAIGPGACESIGITPTSASATASAFASASANAPAAAQYNAAAPEGTLPATGGASLLAVGAGVLLVAGGLLARRVVRS
jgi:hypothetical protein